MVVVKTVNGVEIRLEEATVYSGLQCAIIALIGCLPNVFALAYCSESLISALGNDILLNALYFMLAAAFAGIIWCMTSLGVIAAMSLLGYEGSPAWTVSSLSGAFSQTVPKTSDSAHDNKLICNAVKMAEIAIINHQKELREAEAQLRKLAENCK